MKQKFIITDKLLKKFKKYLIEEERSQATIEKYIRDIKKFRSYLPKDGLITRENVLEYKRTLISEYEVNSANSMLAALNQFLRYIGASNFIVKRIKVQKTIFREEERELSESEYKKMVQNAYDNGKLRLAMIMETICATGIRISELKYFTVAAVKRGKVQVNNKGKVRVILIPEPLRKKLLRYIVKQKTKNGIVFVTANGNPVDRSNTWREMKQIGIDIDILACKIYPHNLRHLFATIYYHVYNDLIGLADILGHSNIETTRIYTAITGKEYKKRMENLSLIL